ncbi:MAG TPA: hypothetical protein VH877_22385 [Polyangia bacterium]|jgi:hypothetical protein|nr:hypothetical protein [Polyangia bacterium]
MPVRIDRIDTEMTVTPKKEAAEEADKRREPRRGGGGGLGEMSDYALRERIKPMVLDILTEEIYRLKRRGDLH